PRHVAAAASHRRPANASYSPHRPPHRPDTSLTPLAVPASLFTVRPLMETVRPLLTRGNGKLGEGIHAWSLLAVETCPGRSALCGSVVYARSGRYATARLRNRLQENLDAALADYFVKKVVAEIRRRGVHTVRVHVSGDFLSPEYTRKW